VHCRDHVVQLHRAREQFEAAGVDLVLIGQATPRHAAHFRKRMELEPLTVLADEDRVSYRVAGWERGSVSQLVGPRSVAAGVKHARRSGVMQGRPVGDVSQLGGEMIITPDGDVVWSHAQRNAGDTTSPDDLVEAAQAVSRAG
jgi:peroxiredoxin